MHTHTDRLVVYVDIGEHCPTNPPPTFQNVRWILELASDAAWLLAFR